MPILNQRVIDAKPKLSATAQSSDKLFDVTIQRRHVAIQRLSTGGILRLAYGEVQSLIDILGEAKSFLESNGEGTNASFDDQYEAPKALNVAENPRGPREKKDVPASTENAKPNEAVVTSSAIVGTGNPAAKESDGHADNDRPVNEDPTSVAPGAAPAEQNPAAPQASTAPAQVSNDNPFA